MNRLWTMATASVVAAVLLLASAIVATAAPAPDPPGKEAEKWEYCEVNSGVALRRDPPVGGEPAVVKVHGEVVRWITADEVVEATGWEDMATKMKAPAPKKETPALSQQMRVFNHLGGQGWELVSYRQTTPPGFHVTTPVHVWLFKRKVAK